MDTIARNGRTHTQNLVFVKPVTSCEVLLETKLFYGGFQVLCMDSKAFVLIEKRKKKLLCIVSWAEHYFVQNNMIGLISGYHHVPSQSKHVSHSGTFPRPHG